MNKKLLCAILSVLMLFTAMTSLVACTDKDNSTPDKGNQSTDVTYRIDFISNGGGAVEAIVKKAGEEITEPAVPVKSGFVFDGWYESSDNGSTLADKPFVFAYMPAQSLTLYAKWTEQIVKYTITFETDGGTEIASIEAKAGEKIEEPTAPVKDGYIFGGWYESSDNGATLAEKPFVFAYMPAQSLTLYAKWTLKSVAGKTYKQSDVRFNWKNEEEKALFLANAGASEEECVKPFETYRIEILFVNDEKVTVSFHTNNGLATYQLYYTINDENVMIFYENAQKKEAGVKLSGVGLFENKFRLSDDRGSVIIAFEVGTTLQDGSRILVELDIVCTVGGK